MSTTRLALLRQLERNIAEHMPERLATLGAVRSLIIETEAELGRDATEQATSGAEG